jgi:hypothetical protein
VSHEQGQPRRDHEQDDRATHGQGAALVEPVGLEVEGVDHLADQLLEGAGHQERDHTDQDRLTVSRLEKVKCRAHQSDARSETDQDQRPRTGSLPQLERVLEQAGSHVDEEVQLERVEQKGEHRQHDSADRATEQARHEPVRGGDDRLVSRRLLWTRCQEPRGRPGEQEHRIAEGHDLGDEVPLAEPLQDADGGQVHAHAPTDETGGDGSP